MLPLLRRVNFYGIWLIAIAVLAAMGGSAAIVAATSYWEAAWLGPVAAAFVLPSVGVYWFLRWCRPQWSAKYLGLLLPVAAVVAVFVTPWCGPVALRCGGGVGITKVFAIAVFGSTVAIGVSLGLYEWYGRRYPRRASLRFKVQWTPAGGLAVLLMGAIALLSCGMWGVPLGCYVFAWAFLTFDATIVVQGTDAEPEGGPRFAWLLAVAALYLPFLVVPFAMWQDRDVRPFLFYLRWIPVAPGVMTSLTAAVWTTGKNIDIWPVFGFFSDALLSVVIVGLTAWLASRSALIRWSSLAGVAFAAAHGAIALFHLFRA